MSKRTKGPWSVHHDGGWYLVMAGGERGRIVANVNPESCPDASSAPAFRVMPGLDNANLIAAAPELLDALKECELFIRVLGLDSRPASELAEKARAAISKALGEQT